MSCAGGGAAAPHLKASAGSGCRLAGSSFCCCCNIKSSIVAVGGGEEGGRVRTGVASQLQRRLAADVQPPRCQRSQLLGRPHWQIAVIAPCSPCLRRESDAAGIGLLPTTLSGRQGVKFNVRSEGAPGVLDGQDDAQWVSHTPGGVHVQTNPPCFLFGLSRPWGLLGAPRQSPTLGARLKQLLGLPLRLSDRNK